MEIYSLNVSDNYHSPDLGLGQDNAPRVNMAQGKSNFIYFTNLSIRISFRGLGVDH